MRAWVPGDYTVLGTDGFGRSDTREKLRYFFEVDRYFVTVANSEADTRIIGRNLARRYTEV